MKITDEMIQRIELDPYDEWCSDPNDGTINVGITEIEQDVRDFFNMQPEDWPDSYVNIYAIINPKLKEVVEIETHIVDGCDGFHDKGETIKVPMKLRKKILKQLFNDKTLGTELKTWIDSYEEE